MTGKKAKEKTSDEPIPIRGTIERVSCPYCGEYDVETVKQRAPTSTMGRFKCRGCRKEFSQPLPKVKV